MNAQRAQAVFRRRLAIAVVGAATLSSGLTPAEARVRPRVAAFASVARGAEIDPLAAGDTLRPAERAFLRQAIEATRREARLAQLGVGQATGSELRTLAQQLATDCRQIADSLDGVARKKGVAIVTAAEAVPENYTRLSELSGPSFDQEFARVVFAMTEDLIKMFEQALADAKDTELRDAIGTHLPAVRDHANRARELRKTFE